MSLRLRFLKLRIVTSKGTYGANLQFEDGLVLIRAGNSAGKSTCLQAVIYALGLEGMFSASRDVPLPHSMTDWVEIEGGSQKVLESEVLLEIENRTEDRITVQRTVKGERNRNLVKVWQGPALTAPSEITASQDYYVRESGGATSPSGFHKYLAAFMGWDLPSVPRFDGRDTPLYMETIFPLIFVEQKRGWTAIEGRFPTQFGIRDLGQRAVEFLLGLDAYLVATRKAELLAEAQRVKEKWARQITLIAGIAKASGAVIQGIPANPTGAWPPVVAPLLLLPEGENWVGIEPTINQLATRLRDLEAVEIRETGSMTDSAEEELRQHQERLAVLDREVRAAIVAFQSERGELDAIDRRRGALNEDIVRNQDALRLQRLGSIQELSSTNNHCPTCHQIISASLLTEEGSSTTTMSVADNLSYLQEQASMYDLLREQAEAALQTRQVQVEAAQLEARELRGRIRALKDTLVSDARSPSRADIETRIRLGERLQALNAAQREVTDALNAFVELAVQWVEVRSALDSLPEGRFSKEDERKLTELEAALRLQLVEYGMESVSPESITLSRDSYRPVYEGFDLQFDLSASDTIRTIWAYRQAMLEVSRTHTTNHPGLLILDEPRQQETAIESLRIFLRHAASAGKFKQQVIVATSETSESIAKYLDGVDATVLNFDDRIIARLEEGPGS